MNEAGFVQNQWVETLWNCCPHTYNTPLYPAINMEMTRKWPVDTSTMISNHQTRLKQQHPPLPMWALLVTRIRGRLAHVYRGALTWITTLGLPKTNEMNHDNQQVKTTYERHLDLFFCMFVSLFFVSSSPPCRGPFTVYHTSVLHHATFASHHCDRPWRNDTSGESPPLGSGCCSGVWVNPGLKPCTEGNDFLYKPYLFEGE